MADLKRLRLNALQYLREGKVVVRWAESTPGARRPHAVQADVQGHRGRYRVELVDGEWYSSCPCIGDGRDCPHIPAVQLVTGHPSMAGKGSR